MVSLFHCSALTKSFPSSYHLYHLLPLYFAKLASLSLPWHVQLWLSCFCWGSKNPGISSNRNSFASFRVSSCLSFPTSLLLHGTERLSRFLHLVLERPWKRVASWPLSRHRGLPGSTSPSSRLSLPGRMKGGGGGGGGRKREGEQPVGLWDHYAVTHIPPFCSECLNMKTTQLLLTPAPPPKHSSH